MFTSESVWSREHGGGGCSIALGAKLVKLLVIPLPNGSGELVSVENFGPPPVTAKGSVKPVSGYVRRRRGRGYRWYGRHLGESVCYPLGLSEIFHVGPRSAILL